MDIPVDIKLRTDDFGQYDIDWSQNGDFTMTNTLQTATLMSANCERRAKSYEVASAELRRGWIGNLVNESIDIEDGCGNWLYQQRRLNSETINGVRDETEKGLLWMVADGLAKSLAVVTNVIDGKIVLSIVIKVTDTEYLEETITL